MPGTGHSHRFKSSISSRNARSRFNVLAPWSARKTGNAGDAAVSQGGDTLVFKQGTGTLAEWSGSGLLTYQRGGTSTTASLNGRRWKSIVIGTLHRESGQRRHSYDVEILPSPYGIPSLS